MTNNRRVVLNENGLLVSKPGFDADTAALPDLQFSSDFRMTRVKESGFGEFTQASSSFTAQLITTIYLTQSYSVPPHVRYAIVYDDLNGGPNQNRSEMRYSSSFLIGKVNAVPVSTRYTVLSTTEFYHNNTYLYVYTDRIAIYNQVGNGTIYFEVYEELT